MRESIDQAVPAFDSSILLVGWQLSKPIFRGSLGSWRSGSILAPNDSILSGPWGGYPSQEVGGDGFGKLS